MGKKELKLKAKAAKAKAASGGGMRRRITNWDTAAWTAVEKPEEFWEGVDDAAVMGLEEIPGDVYAKLARGEPVDEPSADAVEDAADGAADGAADAAAAAADAAEAEAPPPPVAEAPGGTTSVAFDSAKALGVELEYDGAAKLVRLTLAQPESAARDVAPGSVLVAINGEPLELPEVCLGEDHLSLARKKVIAAKGEGPTLILDFQDA